MILVCAGDRLNCSKEKPCAEWKGHCSDLKDNIDCQLGLRCGNSNCLTKLNGASILSNCCFKAQGI